ncbi:hypothetical protein Tco_1104713 [Tanacetum coccineum]
MDDLNITMEEYIRFEEEKAQRHGRTFDWQTATFGKVESYEDEDDCFTDFETEFPAIVFDNTLTTDTTLLCAPKVCPPNKNKIDFRMSLDESDDEDCTEMAETGFGAYWDGTPSYVIIQDPVRRQCHRMIAYSISGRGQAPEKVTDVDLFYLRSMDRGTANVPHLLAQYLFRHAEGRKSGAWLSGGHFIGHLAMHFRLFNTWDWVAQGPERQQAAMAGAYQADEAGLAAEKGAQEIPAQAPPPPLLVPQPRTMSQKIERIKEEVHDLRRDVVGLRGVVESFTTEQSRVSTWLISCMTQLMDASGYTY